MFSLPQRQTEVVKELEYEISLLSNTKQILTEELKKLQRCQRTFVALPIERSLLDVVGGLEAAALENQIKSRNAPSTLDTVASCDQDALVGEGVGGAPQTWISHLFLSAPHSEIQTLERTVSSAPPTSLNLGSQNASCPASNAAMSSAGSHSVVGWTRLSFDTHRTQEGG